MKKLLTLALFGIALTFFAQDYQKRFREIPQEMRQQKGDTITKYHNAVKQIAAVQPPAPNADPQKAAVEKQRFEDARSNACLNLLNQLANVSVQLAYDEFQKMLKDGLYSPQFTGRALPNLASAAIRGKNRDVWEKLWRQFKKLPPNQRNLWGTTVFFQQFPLDLAQKKMAEFYAENPDLSDRDKFTLNLSFVQSQLNSGNYTWAKGQVPSLENQVKSLKYADLKGFYAGMSRQAFANSDLTYAREMAEKSGEKTILLYLNLLDAGRDYAKCVQLLTDALKTWSKDDVNFIKQARSAIYLFENNGDLKKFDETFKTEKFTPGQKLSFVREGCYLLWRVRKYELIQKTDANIYSDWFIPFEIKFYEVKYTDQAPVSAAAWIQTPYYNDWKQMEQRFFRYDDQYQSAEWNDLNHLKGVEQKPLDDAYRTGVHFLADVHGLHIYIRGNDPSMNEVFEGKRNAGGMECYFKPGYDAPYSMWFCNELPKCIDTFEVDFAGASSKYKFTIDCIKRDAQITREAVVVHALIPWEDFIHYLPFTGNMWYFGMQRWCKDSRTLSGHVHELERMVRLRFNFSREDKTAILRQICRKSYNTYTNLRNDRNGKILQWNQPDVGDIEFYEKALLPMLNELDEAGKKIDTADLATLEKLQAEYAPRWQNILYEIDRIRTKWLKDQLMK